MRLEARPRNAEGTGEVTIRDLVANALRMRPDRIVVGECRGAEALDMLQAMNTGHDGSLTTLHANSPEEAISRLTMLVRFGADLPVDVIEENIAHALDLVVQVERCADGARRIASAAELLFDDGHTVHTWALEGTEEGPVRAPDLGEAALADCVILPLPAAGEGGRLNAPLSQERPPLTQVLDALRPGQVVCAGKVGRELLDQAKERGLRLVDYFTREELAVANAVPTAEGAIQIAMEELPVTIHGARVLVLGFGRLGKLLAHRLNALGARVSVAARKWADLAWAEAYGYGAEQIERLDGYLCGYDLVVNTVPVRVLDAERLADLRPGCLVIDLASKPGGVDFEAAVRQGVRAIWALSLPGKVAPVTSGKIIRDTIYNIWNELGV